MWEITAHNLFFVPYLTLAEGFVLGVGAKMFLIAGPVIVYGVAAGVIYGVVIWLFGLY